jgi:hypothetical protein
VDRKQREPAKKGRVGARSQAHPAREWRPAPGPPAGRWLSWADGSMRIRLLQRPELNVHWLHGIAPSSRSRLPPCDQRLCTAPIGGLPTAISEIRGSYWAQRSHQRFLARPTSISWPGVHLRLKSHFAFSRDAPRSRGRAYLLSSGGSSGDMRDDSRAFSSAKWVPRHPDIVDTIVPCAPQGCPSHPIPRSLRSREGTEPRSGECGQMKKAWGM